MRLLTWNMAYWKPGSYKAPANRQRQWALIAALGPDVACLQECRPDDLHKHAPAWLGHEYEIVGEIPSRWTACSAVIVRKSLKPMPLDPTGLPDDERRWRDYLSGYMAAATIEVAGQQIRVASVHAIAKEVDSPAVTDDDHARLHRPALTRAWHNDLAVATLGPWVADSDFIVAGDWNNALLFDANYPEGAGGGAGASLQFFQMSADKGWCDALRKFHEQEVRTYLDAASDAYELDRIFTNSALNQRLTQCTVIAEPAVLELSDHAPMVAEIDPTTTAER